MICFQCGNSVAQEDTICSNCGAQLQRRSRNLNDSSDNLRRISQHIRAIPRVKPLIDIHEKFINRFKVLSILGEGHWAQSYEAHDSKANNSDNEVTLQVFRADIFSSDAELEHFITVAQRARTLAHPNTVRLLDCGIHDGMAWVSMQMLEGMTLQAAMEFRQARKSRYTMAEIGPIFLQIVQGLNALDLHGHYGHLRPDTILLLPEFVKLTDYYLLEALPERHFVDYLHSNKYLAPEISEYGHQGLTVSNDVYSLGVLIRELLLGSNTSGGLVEASDEQAAAIDAIIRRAIAADYRERHSSSVDLYNDFAIIAGLEPIVVPTTEATGITPNLLNEPLPQEGVSEASSITLEELLEEDIATFEINRIETTELVDLLATTEVNRDIHPIAKPKRGGDTQSVEHPSPPTPPSPPAPPKTPKTPKIPTSDDGDKPDEPKQVPPPTPAPAPTSVPEPRPPVKSETAQNQPEVPPKAATKKQPAMLVAIAVLIMAIVGGVGWAIGAKNADISDAMVVAPGNDEQDDTMDFDIDALEAEAQEKQAQQEQARNEADRLANAYASNAIVVASAIEELRQNEGATTDIDESTTEDNNSGAPARPTSARAPASAPKSPPPPPPPATNCPDNMVFIKARGGNYCIDTHEFPGAGSMPKTNVNWFDANRQCAAQNKRLCTRQEFRNACGGAYPYGSRYNPDRCNTADEDGFERRLAKSGSFSQCRTSKGIYDLSGNVYEWVNEQQVVGGGYDSESDLASCRYSSPKVPGSSDANVGFRCCADPS